MNVLSFSSLLVAVAYLCLFIDRARKGVKDASAAFTLAVFACLGWWAFCDAFFYVAETESSALFWYHLGALGYSGFIPVTAYYFVIMNGDSEKFFSKWYSQLLYWLPGLVLTVLFMLPGHGAFAESIVPSESGLGWAYVQHFDTIWPYLLLLELFVYLGTALIRLYLWQRKIRGSADKTLSVGFIVLDALSVTVGFVIIYIMPQFSTYLPPMCFIATAIFMLGYWYELRNHDLKHIELALDPSYIFENSMDAVLITDANWVILYANREAKRIIGQDKPEGSCFADRLTSDGKDLLMELIQSGAMHSHGMELFLAGHIPLLCSVSRTSTRKGRHQVFVISMHDASILRGAQEKLEHLAAFDELTGLPNRRRLGELLDIWEEKYTLTGADFSVLFMDLNYFKSINDAYGHDAGDKALVAVSKALSDCISEGDEAARMSGDEFIVLHASGGISDHELVTMINKAVKEIDCSSFAPGIKLDASIGLCRYSDVGSVHKLIKIAVERMYETKRKIHSSTT